MNRQHAAAAIIAAMLMALLLMIYDAILMADVDTRLLRALPLRYASVILSALLLWRAMPPH